MGNHCAGLKEKTNFEWIERTKGNPRSSESIFDSEVRLSESQLEKISEYQERFLKVKNPAEKLFDDETHQKIIENDKGYVLMFILY